jgi:glycosyltransferase involved in cell wall biosynthesis
MTHPLTVGYVVSRFPKLSETFILNEMLELERLGVRVELFPLVRERESSMQPGAAEFAARAHVVRPLSRAIVAAQWYWLRRRPRRYLATWAGAIIGNRNSRKFLLRTLVVVPTAAAFARTMDAVGVDHVHAHWATHPALAAWAIRSLTGRAYSFTAHAHDIYVERSMLGEKVRDAAVVVTISDHNRRLLEGWYGGLAEHVTVIHCGVDADIFRPRVDSGPPDSGPPASDRPLEAVTVATLQPQKGHRVLVEAIRLLAARGVEVHARFVGDGEERPALGSTIADAGLAGRIELLGRRPSDEVADLVRAADVVVQPSVILPDGKTEGIPVALMEAMASGTPVIATAVSGVPELVEDGVTGRLVPPGDAAALADALLAIRAEPEATARMALAGRERVLAAFDLRANTRRLAETFVAIARAAGRDVADLPARTRSGGGPADGPADGPAS